MRIAYFTYIGCMLVAALSSCSKDPVDTRNPNPEGIAVSFTANRAFSEAANKSQTLQESQVVNMQVVVFENGRYIYTAQGQNIRNSANTATFEAFLRSSNQPLTLFFIANSNPVPVSPGQTPEELSTLLVNNFTPSGTSLPLPMFGDINLPGGLNTLTPNTISGINLLRSTARIDLIVSGDITNFVPKTIQVFRANNLSQIIPNTLSSEIGVTLPSVPAASTATVNTTPQSITGISFQSQLYLSEANAPAAADQTSDATCVILGGYFNGSSTLSYYRLDFDSGLTGHPFGQILRNYRYILQVNSVYIAGFSTPDEAAANPSTGSTGTVKVWNDRTSYMSFDPQFFLGVSSINVLFNSQAGAIQEIEVETNVASYDMQFADENGTPISPPSDNLNNGLFSIEKLNGGNTIRLTTLTDNSVGPVNSYLLLTSGNLRVLITVTQGIFGVSPRSFTISGSGGEGFLLVKSSSLWGVIPDVDWLSASISGDSIKWTAQNNPVGMPPRSGLLRVSNLAGEVEYVPFTQEITNTKILRIHSVRSGLGYLGATTTVTTAETRAQGLKGILTNTANFGLTGKVNCGGFTFTETTTVPYTISPADTTDLSVFYSPDLALQGNIPVATATALATWLRSANNRVMVICFDESNRNANLLSQFGVNDVIYGVSTGAFPLQYTAATNFFTTSGHFTAYPSVAISTGFSFRNYDGAHGEIPVATHPNITPILLGPQGGIVLGVDQLARVVYVGDMDLFNSAAGTGATSDNRILNTTGQINNNASKLVANVWAWIAGVCLSQ